MQRLTINKDVSEMSMIELAHNCCYVKDCKARYRDYGTDTDARKLAIKLLDELADIPNEFTSDDDFDGYIYDSLRHGTNCVEGLIAVFYRNLWAMADLHNRLKHYEDLEEQKMLILLPCKFGDTVYVKTQSGEYAKAEVKDFTYFHSCGFCIVAVSDEFGKQNIPFSEFGKSVFSVPPAAVFENVTGFEDYQS